MAAITMPHVHQLTKRHWASENPGVVLVFAIVFVVGCGIIILFLYRKWMARKAVKESYPVDEE